MHRYTDEPIGDRSVDFSKCLQAGLLFVVCSTLFGCSQEQGSVPSEPDVESSYHEWSLNGRNHYAQRFSTLDQINDDNVERLSLAWYFDVDAPDGLVATPIVVNGKIYVTGPFSIVYVLDAKSGELIWSFDPEIRFPETDDYTLSVSMSARTNRGVAVSHEKVFVTVADCRLIALDANTGEKIWEQITCDVSNGFAITAAPFLGKDKVFVGNGVSESGLKTRGHVDAYDMDTGEHAWRFYIVPSDIPEENASPAMQMAARTWTGNNWQQFGGGGNSWDALTYDPELDLLYFGTAAALPALHKERSPDGGDNLFTQSVLAVDGTTGEYRWHYQAVPQGNWGYDLNTNIILADLHIENVRRKVLMIAPKNGFFYVVDRVTGELLSADNFAEVTWATHIDMDSGRPVINPAANFWDGAEGEFYLYPNSWGAHTWIPMSFNPDLGLAFIPVSNLPARQTFHGDGTASGRLAIPAMEGDEKFVQGDLVAWDPVTQSSRWKVHRENAFNGGTMSTAGNLVFQGTATGKFQAIAADSGEVRWSHDTGSAISAAPVTYQIDEQQYVLIAVGGGGHPRFAEPEFFFEKAALGPSRILAYKLDGTASLPIHISEQREIPEPPPSAANDEGIARGQELYYQKECYFCHGPDVRGALTGTIPDLRYMSRDAHEQWHAIVVGGSRRDKGMASYNISVEDSEAIHAYVIMRSRQDYEGQAAPLDDI